MSANHNPPGAPDANETEPLISTPTTSIAPRLPFHSRLYFGICLWSFKLFVQSALRLLRLNNYLRSINQPTLQKYYSVRPSLEVRIFFPPEHPNASSSTTKPAAKLPTYLNIHGGGFALCDPVVDDHFCHTLAHKHNFLVISLSYSLSPRHPFPVPVKDIQALIPAILSDPSLPIDADRVALGGFSAGGNLALAAPQVATIGAKIKAIVPIYPVVDFSGKYKGELKTSADGQKDMLARSGAWFSWGYINPGQDRLEPLLSPIYAGREKLPQRMFFVGAENDVLCKEAWCMARMLAGKDVEGSSSDPGKGEREWEAEGVRWRMVEGQRHGFTHAQEKDEGREKARVKITEELWTDIAKWLREVFK